jgi:hypothetical protein
MKDQKVKSEVKSVQPAKNVGKEQVLSAKSAVKAGPGIGTGRP